MPGDMCVGESLEREVGFKRDYFPYRAYAGGVSRTALAAVLDAHVDERGRESARLEREAARLEAAVVEVGVGERDALRHAPEVLCQPALARRETRIRESSPSLV